MPKLLSSCSHTHTNSIIIILSTLVWKSRYFLCVVYLCFKNVPTLFVATEQDISCIWEKYMVLSLWPSEDEQTWLRSFHGHLIRACSVAPAAKLSYHFLFFSLRFTYTFHFLTYVSQTFLCARVPNDEKMDQTLSIFWCFV